MFRVTLSDKDFNLLEILDNECIDLTWSFSATGGCGEFNFKLPRKLYEEKSISGDFNIKIYYRNPSTNTYDLWYQGLVENKYPSIYGNSEEIEISGHGYQAQLSRIYIEETYTATETSLIIKDLLDTYVVPNTDISYNASDIEVTSFTPDNLKFNTDVLSALQTCADIVGGRVWGVDKDRNFYFKVKSTNVGYRYNIGADIISYAEDLSFKDIVNQVIIQGAEISGTTYTATFNDTLSQLKYNLRSKVIQKSAITTASVASQFATATFAEYSEVVRNASCGLVGVEALIEATIPIPLLQVLDKFVTYGTRKYGMFLYSGIIDRQINRINYIVTNNNILKIRLELGQIKPSLAEQLGQIEYQLEQQRTASL